MHAITFMAVPWSCQVVLMGHFFLVFGHVHVLLLTLRCFYLCSSRPLVSDVGLEIQPLGSVPVGEFFVVTNTDFF